VLKVSDSSPCRMCPPPAVTSGVRPHPPLDPSLCAWVEHKGRHAQDVWGLQLVSKLGPQPLPVLREPCSQTGGDHHILHSYGVCINAVPGRDWQLTAEQRKCQGLCYQVFAYLMSSKVTSAMLHLCVLLRSMGVLMAQCTLLAADTTGVHQRLC
jgi:hypothetical protein